MFQLGTSDISKKWTSYLCFLNVSWTSLSRLIGLSKLSCDNVFQMSISCGKKCRSNYEAGLSYYHFAAPVSVVFAPSGTPVVYPRFRLFKWSSING